jgi:hypothetical protein
VLLVIVFVACASTLLVVGSLGCGSCEITSFTGSFFRDFEDVETKGRLHSGKVVMKTCDVDRSPPCDLRLKVFHGGRNETSSRPDEAGR